METPKFVTINPPSILLDVLADFKNITGKVLQPGQPEYQICAFIAYQKMLEMQRQQSTGLSQILEFSTAPVLDYVAKLVGITRLPAQNAVCTLQFSLVAGHGALVIPAGLRVSSVDGLVIFSTIADVSVAASTNTVTIDIVTVNAECSVTGVIGNSYEVGTINQILDVKAYISTAKNLDITTGGSNAETDAQLRARAYKAPSQFSTCGPRDAYKLFAYSASPLIIDVEALSNDDDSTIPFGEIDVYPLLANGGLPNQALIESVQAALSGDKVRPLSDLPIVAAPTKIEYSLAIDITKISGSTNDAIVSAVTTAIEAYKAVKIAKLGLDIIASEIESICRVDNVYDLVITITPATGVLTGRNIVVKKNEFAYMTSCNIQIIGANNG